MSATEQDAAARADWQTALATWTTEAVIFLDETSTHTSFTRTHGRAPKGERVLGQVPRNHGPNISCLAALGPHGIISSLAIAGPIDGEVLRGWRLIWCHAWRLAPRSCSTSSVSTAERGSARWWPTPDAACAFCPRTPRTSIPSS